MLSAEHFLFQTLLGRFIRKPYAEQGLLKSKPLYKRVQFGILVNLQSPVRNINKIRQENILLLLSIITDLFWDAIQIILTTPSHAI